MTLSLPITTITVTVLPTSTTATIPASRRPRRRRLRRRRRRPRGRPRRRRPRHRPRPPRGSGRRLAGRPRPRHRSRRRRSRRRFTAATTTVAGAGPGGGTGATAIVAKQRHGVQSRNAGPIERRKRAERRAATPVPRALGCGADVPDRGAGGRRRRPEAGRRGGSGGRRVRRAGRSRSCRARRRPPRVRRGRAGGPAGERWPRTRRRSRASASRASSRGCWSRSTDPRRARAARGRPRAPARPRVPRRSLVRDRRAGAERRPPARHAESSPRAVIRAALWSRTAARRGRSPKSCGSSCRASKASSTGSTRRRPAFPRSVPPWAGCAPIRTRGSRSRSSPRSWSDAGRHDGAQRVACRVPSGDVGSPRVSSPIPEQQSAAADVELRSVTKRFDDVVAVDRLDLDDPAGLVLRPARAVRLRQDDDAPDDRRLRGADGRRDPARRTPRDGPAAVQARRQHRLPELRALPAPVDLRERRLRPAAARKSSGRSQGRVHEMLRLVGSEVRGRKPRPALRRPAAARRARARSSMPAAPASRRAARRARPQAPEADAARAEAHPARARPHLRARHARSGGGDDDGRHDRRHERRPDRAARRAERGSTSGRGRPSSPASSASRTC